MNDLDREQEIKYLKEQIRYLEKTIPQTEIPALADWRQRRLDDYREELAELEEK